MIVSHWAFLGLASVSRVECRGRSGGRACAMPWIPISDRTARFSFFLPPWRWRPGTAGSARGLGGDALLPGRQRTFSSRRMACSISMCIQSRSTWANLLSFLAISAIIVSADRRHAAAQSCRRQRGRGCGLLDIAEEADRRKDEFPGHPGPRTANPLAPLGNALQLWSTARLPTRHESADLRAIMSRQVRPIVAADRRL